MFLVLLFGAWAVALRSTGAAAIPAVAFAPAVDYPIAPQPQWLAAGDFTGDGHLDLVVSSFFVQVLPGDGKGRFGKPVNYPVFHSSYCKAVAGDFNGDGKADLAVLMIVPAPSRLEIWISRPEGGFLKPIAIPLASKTVDLFVADLRGNGRQDIVLSQVYQGLGVLLGNGDGTFQPGFSVWEGEMPYSTVAGDFNRDGSIDLAAGRLDGNSISILLGKGGGALLPGKDSLSVFRPRSLVCADFDSDGLLDLAFVTPEHDSVGLLRGKGNGAFHQASQWPAGNLPVAIVTADFNRDGAPDLASANWQSADLTVLLGSGDGSFAARQTLPVRAFPGALISADFNEDGYPDIAAVSREFNKESVSVLLNLGQNTSNAAIPPASRAVPRSPAPIFTNGPPGLSRYQVVSWKTDRGLPQNSVNCLLKTRDGYLWVGTQHGLARFDGLKFKVFDANSSPPLANCDCLSLAEGENGDLLIGTTQGLAVLREGRFSFPSAPGIPGPHDITSILPGREGRILLGTDEGVFRLHNGSLARVFTNSPPFSQRAPCLAEDKSGGLWATSFRGLLHSLPGSSEMEIAFLRDGPLGKPYSFLRALRLDRNGKIWLGDGADLVSFEKGFVAFIPSSVFRWSGPILGIADDLDGNLWIGGGGGLRLLRGNEITEFGPAEGLTDGTVNCVYPDEAGNIWIGTARGGLNCLQPRRVINYTKEDGLPDEDVWSIAEAEDGGLWIGSAAGAGHFKEGRFTTYQSAYADPNPEWKAQGVISIIQPDAAGNVWARGKEHNLRLADGRLVEALALKRLGRISSAYKDRQNKLWFSCGGNFASLEEGELKIQALTNCPSGSPDLLGILQDYSGGMWLGSFADGLFRVHQGRVSRLTRNDGLSSDMVAPVLADPDGTIWAVSDKGLNRLKDGRITRYTTAQGLAENIILNALEDDYGWLWLNGHQGIHRVLKQELIDLAEGRRATVDSITCNTSDGMLGSEGNGGSFPNSCKTRDGRLWFPTTKGLVMIDPKPSAGGQQIPPVIIESLSANKKRVYDQGTPPVARSIPAVKAASFSRLSAHQGRSLLLPPEAARLIEIQYTAPIFSAPERTLFRCRLEGYDADWQDGGDSRRAVYANLSPGDYRFRVIARSSQGVWNRVGDSLEFRLAPHYYQTGWFYGLCAAAILLLAAGVQASRLAVQRKILGLEQAAALARERERIARDIHDDLGAGLTRIALLGDVARRELDPDHKALPQIGKLSAIAREVVDSVGELVWATNPKYDTLDGLVSYFREYAAQFFASTPIETLLHFPGAVPLQPVTADFRRHLFLVLKEALRNAARHADATRVEVSLALEPGQFVLEIADNGRGFATAERPSPGHGLGNMRARMQALGGTLELLSEPAGGARVRARAPLALSKPRA